MVRSLAVIFDMDGVILDSERLAMDAWKALGARRGLVGIDTALEEVTGVTESVSRVAMKRRYGEDFDFDEWTAAARVERLKLCNGVIPAKDGAEELLRWLRAQRIPTALASSTRRAHVIEELSAVGLAELFDVLICGDMVAASKPAPDIFLRAAEALDAAPERCWVIEDSHNGIRAAAAAGMHPIMVPDRMPVTEEMCRLAEKILPSLHAVQTVLEAQAEPVTAQ